MMQVTNMKRPRRRDGGRRQSGGVLLGLGRSLLKAVFLAEYHIDYRESGGFAGHGTVFAITP
jgi:hypothetical protein